MTDPVPAPAGAQPAPRAALTATSGRSRLISGPAIGRTITLTDAVVAIAMTLLILPMVDVADQVDTAHPVRWLGTHGDLLLSFVVSFLVIYVFWSAHAGALRRLELADAQVPGLGLLNMLWLLVIAFLPFPTAVVGHNLDTTSVPVYIGTMLVLSAVTSGIVAIAERAGERTGRTGWAWATTAAFAACTVVGLVNASAGLFALLLLLALRTAEARALRAHRRPVTDHIRADSQTGPRQ